MSYLILIPSLFDMALTRRVWRTFVLTTWRAFALKTLLPHGVVL